MNILARRSVLAIAAVVDVALHSRAAPVAAKALAARHKLPARHLETLLQGLVHAGILKGVRGPRGGYELARERRRITVGEIVRIAMSLSTADPEDLGANSVLLERVIDPAIRRAAETRFTTLRVRLLSTRPPLILLFGLRPSHEVKALALRHLLISTPVSETIVSTLSKRSP